MKIQVKNPFRQEEEGVPFLLALEIFKAVGGALGKAARD